MALVGSSEAIPRRKHQLAHECISPSLGQRLSHVLKDAALPHAPIR